MHSCTRTTLAPGPGHRTRAYAKGYRTQSFPPHTPSTGRLCGQTRRLKKNFTERAACTVATRQAAKAQTAASPFTKITTAAGDSPPSARSPDDPSCAASPTVSLPKQGGWSGESHRHFLLNMSGFYASRFPRSYKDPCITFQTLFGFLIYQFHRQGCTGRGNRRCHLIETTRRLYEEGRLTCAHWPMHLHTHTHTNGADIKDNVRGRERLNTANPFSSVLVLKSPPKIGPLSPQVGTN